MVIFDGLVIDGKSLGEIMAEILAIYCEPKGHSLSNLADQKKLAYSTLRNVRNQKYEISMETCLKICNAVMLPQKYRNQIFQKFFPEYFEDFENLSSEEAKKTGSIVDDLLKDFRAQEMISLMSVKKGMHEDKINSRWGEFGRDLFSKLKSLEVAKDLGNGMFRIDDYTNNSVESICRKIKNNMMLLNMEGFPKKRAFIANSSFGIDEKKVTEFFEMKKMHYLEERKFLKSFPGDTVVFNSHLSGIYGEK